MHYTFAFCILLNKKNDPLENEMHVWKLQLVYNSREFNNEEKKRIKIVCAIK